MPIVSMPLEHLFFYLLIYLSLALQLSLSWGVHTQIKLLIIRAVRYGQKIYITIFFIFFLFRF